MSDLWQFVDGLYARHAAEHERKLGSLYVREQKLVNVTFKGEPAEQPALCFKVVNKSASSGGPSLHNVLISLHPKKKVFTVWCGDTSVAKEDKERESPCEFWRKFGQAGEDTGYACKHIVYMVQQTKGSGRKQVEEMLGQDLPMGRGGEGVGIALKLGKSALVYGPTGSGKTHLVRECLAEHPGLHVCRIHVTDGLEDVDLLQKLLPDPETKGWRRVQGELRTAFDLARDRKVAVVLEELTRSSRSLRNLLIKAMDREAGHYTLHDITTSERITVSADNMLFLATANLGYSDTSALDPALARRFPICVFMDYDSAKERTIIEGLVDRNTAVKVCKVARALREQFRQGRLPYPLDTGSVIEWADVIAKGFDVIKAAELTWLYRVVERDPMGYPEEGQLSAILDILR
jgi:hypothetical protein